ncbi:MAG TPA: TfoX/Sxy family protein, partial [Gemmatimonadales bacterium]|nr:TfoX/Sxy family protein [Gemmatimonadales bacterium]
MAYDEKFADRIRQALGRRKGLVAKQMFGGIAFLLNGNMCVGIHKDELIVRLDPDATDAALAKPHTRVFNLTGRPMKGWILVGPKGIATGPQLKKWIAIAAAYAG